MSIALQKPMTMTAFLAWEDQQELRYEFDGIQPVAMVGGTVAHSAIQRNLLFQLTAALRGRPCRPHGSHLKIQVAGRIRYPDAFVVCTPTPAQVKVEPCPRYRVQPEGRGLGHRTGVRSGCCAAHARNWRRNRLGRCLRRYRIGARSARAGQRVVVFDEPIMLGNPVIKLPGHPIIRLSRPIKPRRAIVLRRPRHRFDQRAPGAGTA